MPIEKWKCEKVPELWGKTVIMQSRNVNLLLFFYAAFVLVQRCMAGECYELSPCFTDNDCQQCAERNSLPYSCVAISDCYNYMAKPFENRCNDNGGLYEKTICIKDSDCKSGHCIKAGMCLSNPQGVKCPILFG